MIVLGLPKRSNSPRLQHAEQLGLHLGRQLADLVEKERRAVRDLEAPGLARQGPGVGALLPPEQLALHQPGRQRGAVDLDHQLAPAGAEPVDGLGDELLAGAGLAAHEYRGIRGRHLLHQAQELPDGGALPGDLAVRVDHPDLGLEVVAFRLEPVLQFLDLRVRLPQRLLALPSLRDVAEDAVRLPHASLGVARGDAGHEMEPPLPTSRVDEAILDGDLLQPSVVKLLALLHEVRTVVGMHALHEELHWQKALLTFRGKADEVAKPGVDEGDSFLEVHLVEPETGEVGGRLQASLTRANSLFGSLPLGDVDRDAHQSLWLAAGRPAGTRAGVDPAHASIAREDDPAFHADRFLRPRGLLEGSA